MLVQEEMIVRLRHLCERDTRVTGALLGGSFAQGEGDEFSDFDAVLSRAVEQDLPPAAYTRYVSCTAALHPDALWGAYCASWIWGNEMLHVLLSRHELPTPHALLERLEQRVTDGHRSPTAAGIEQGTDQV